MATAHAPATAAQQPQAAQGDQQRCLCVSFLGCAQSGKSTLVAHLLSKLAHLHGSSNPEGYKLARAEQEATDAGQREAIYAWAMYKRKAERQLNMSLDLSVKCGATPTSRMAFTDAPGRREAVHFVSRGVSGQDGVVLVVDASCTDTLGERAIADTDQGLLYEHALIAYGLGIRQLVVAVNKMDAVDFSQLRFQEVQAEVLRVLKKANYNEEQRKKVVFVPVAGFPGDNLAELSGRMPWYERARGATLLGALEALEPSQRLSQPLSQPPLPSANMQQQQQQQGEQQQQIGGQGAAMCNGGHAGYAGLVLPVQFVVKISGIGTVCLGRVEAGTLCPGMQVAFLPPISLHPALPPPVPTSSQGMQVKSVECSYESVSSASSSSNATVGGTGNCGGSSTSGWGSVGPGCSVGMALQGVQQRLVHRGWVAVDARCPPRLVSLFRARILIKRDDVFNGRARPHQPPGPAFAVPAKRSKRAARQEPQTAESRTRRPSVQAPYYCPVLDVHASHAQCRMVRVVHKLSGKTGKPIDEPEQLRNTLTKGDAAVVDFAPLWPILVAPREESHVLGSFVLREKNYVVGIGGVTEILDWWRPPSAPAGTKDRGSKADGTKRKGACNKDALGNAVSKDLSPAGAPEVQPGGAGTSLGVCSGGVEEATATAAAKAEETPSISLPAEDAQQPHGGYYSSQTGEATDEFCGFSLPGQ